MVHKLIINFDTEHDLVWYVQICCFVHQFLYNVCVAALASSEYCSATILQVYVLCKCK